MSWSLAPGRRDYVIGHAFAVLPDKVLDDARIVVRAGVVSEVGRHPAGSSADVDARGLAVLPGLVDVHSDVLGREVHPRPGATLPPAFALASASARLRSAGVTTAFHGLAYQACSAVGLPIGSPAAAELEPIVDAADDAYVDHRVLHRLDVRCELGRAALAARLATLEGPAVVSHEDHTPGQGQYADPLVMERWLVTGEGFAPEAAAEHVARWRDERDDRFDVRDSALAWLAELVAAGRVTLFGHDPSTLGDVAGIVARGGRVAEFPTTLEAAEAAREAGLLIVAGAPNVVRGGSHSGNVSATELAAAGLVDALASDYLPTALLPAVVTLAGSGAVSLAAAVALVTAGPAAAVGLADRGALVPGARADLLVADLDSAVPVPVTTLRSADTFATPACLTMRA